MYSSAELKQNQKQSEFQAKMARMSCAMKRKNGQNELDQMTDMK